MDAPGITPFYRDDQVVIYHGDCKDVLPLLQPVQHIITDPPYHEHVHSRSRRGGESAPPLGGDGNVALSSFHRTKEFGFVSLDDLTRGVVAYETARLCQRWGLFFSDERMAPRWAEDLEDAGLEFVRIGAWIKLGCTPQFTGDRPATGFEHITIVHPPGRKRWNGGGRPAVWSVPIVLNRGGRKDRVHETQKPEALMCQLIADFTDPGDIILDPFMGSGSTLVAAKRLGRRAIGIELRRVDCETAVGRLQQGSLLAVAAGVGDHARLPFDAEGSDAATPVP